MDYFIRGFIFFAATVAILLVIMIVLPRIRMLRRANALLRDMPNHERTTIYVQFSSWLPNRKQKEMDAKVAEMAKDGWVFLKAGEANPLKTMWSWGGGVNLYFIRDIADLDCTE